MTFPTISYKYNGIEAAKSLADVVEEKFNSLGKFITEQAATKCEVEFEKATGHIHGRIHRVEVTLSINGHVYRAEATEHTFEEAIDKVRDELDGELSRAKDKHHTLEKHEGRVLKERMLQSE